MNIEFTKIMDLPITIIDGDRSSKYPKRDEFKSSGVPFLNSTNISDGALDLSETNYISEEKYQSIKKGRVVSGDIVMTTRGSIGKVARIPKGFRGLINAQMLILRSDEKQIDGAYIYYLFRSDDVQTKLKNFSSGSAQPQIPIRDLQQIDLPIVSLPIQRRIASILSAYDDLIENDTRRIAILEEMARRIYEEWFVHFRFPGHENVRMVESELGLIPEGWTVCPLEVVCSRITDGSHSSPPSVSDGKPMASVKDMTDWGINVQSCRRISEDDYKSLVGNDCKPRLNDILIAKDGSYLKHTFVADEEIEMVILSSIAILRPNGLFLPNQLALYLRLPQVKSRMKGYVSGVAVPRIVLKDFRKFLVLVPPNELQSQWAKACDSMLSLCRKLVKANTNLRTTRDLLLPKLISGELDVSQLPEPEGIAA